MYGRLPCKFGARGKNTPQAGVPKRTENGMGELRDFLDFTVANARRANTHALTGAVHQRAHRLQVEVPAPFRNVMSVADLVAECRLPTAYFANLCHGTEISYVNRILSIAMLFRGPQVGTQMSGSFSGTCSIPGNRWPARSFSNPLVKIVAINEPRPRGSGAFRRIQPTFASPSRSCPGEPLRMPFSIPEPAPDPPSDRRHAPARSTGESGSAVS
jgi:hypothetical protein